MQAAILEIGAIYVSADVHDGWGVAARKKKITGHASLPVVKPMRKADSLGGHAFALVGFNRTGFVVQNSWGLPWGNCGFGVMPYEDWVKYGTDAWTAALGVPRQRRAKTSGVPVPFQGEDSDSPRRRHRVPVEREGAAAEGEQGSRAVERRGSVPAHDRDRQRRPGHQSNRHA